MAKTYDRAEVQATLEEVGIEFDNPTRMAILDEIMKEGPLTEEDVRRLVSAARAPMAQRGIVTPGGKQSITTPAQVEVVPRPGAAGPDEAA